jgi:hypothetical protein
MKSKRSEGPWIKLRLEMLESPAWGALTRPAKKVIERLMIEHMKHGGKNNGRLICTYLDFIAFQIRDRSIADGLGQAVELGFVEVTARGGRFAGRGQPAQYRLTFMPTDGAEPTDEWRGIRENNIGRKTVFRGANARRPGAKTPVQPRAKTPVQGKILPIFPGAKTPLLSRSSPSRGRQTGIGGEAERRPLSTGTVTVSSANAGE